MKKYIIIDSESNGPYVTAEVWQIAWVVTDCHFAPLKTDSGFLMPISRMAPRAKEITGFDRATLKKNAEPADILYARFLRDLRGCQAIIGHSVYMDVSKLIHDAERRCTPALADRVSTALSTKQQYDTMSHTVDFVGKVITRCIWRYGVPVYLAKVGYPSLLDLARKLGVAQEDIRLHSADGDVELTRRCMAEIKKSHRVLMKDLMHGEVVNPNPERAWYLDT